MTKAALLMVLLVATQSDALARDCRHFKKGPEASGRAAIAEALKSSCIFGKVLSTGEDQDSYLGVDYFGDISRVAMTHSASGVSVSVELERGDVGDLVKEPQFTQLVFKFRSDEIGKREAAAFYRALVNDNGGLVLSHNRASQRVGATVRAKVADYDVLPFLVD